MKKLIVAVCNDGLEVTLDIVENLDSAIDFIKEHASQYYNSKYKIYSLSNGVAVRYLDNKIFID